MKLYGSTPAPHLPHLASWQQHRQQAKVEAWGEAHNTAHQMSWVAARPPVSSSCGGCGQAKTVGRSMQAGGRLPSTSNRPDHVPPPLCLCLLLRASLVVTAPQTHLGYVCCRAPRLAGCCSCVRSGGGQQGWPVPHCLWGGLADQISALCLT